MKLRPTFPLLQEVVLFARPSAILDQWAKREARPISLRQLTFYGRSLTEKRLLGSANYVRTELPTRIAHRLRDMQTLPYLVLTNPHVSHVFQLYYKAFDTFRAVPNISTLQENDRFCETVKDMLQEHLSVIPKLVLGITESQSYMPSNSSDGFLTSMLRSRISRRVIAEQHISLTDTYKSQPGHSRNDYVGEIFLKCDVKATLEHCAKVTSEAMQSSHNSDNGNYQLPALQIQGHLQATFPYILNQLEYMIGEILRNSMQAIIERHRQRTPAPNLRLPPIEVLVCETDQHVMLRFSDQGGGIPRALLPHIWSFSSRGRPKRDLPLETLKEVPLSFSSTRLPQLKIGFGLPMSKIYTEYWAGSLDVHNLEGYGLDVFLQICKLGTKTRIFRREL